MTQLQQVASLFAAIERGHVQGVRDLLARDPTLVSARDQHGATPLHVAAFNGNREVMDVLLAAGADINARDSKYDATPAGWAIHYLRERGALLGVELEDLRFAIERRDFVWVERFVRRHPALIRAMAPDGVALAAHARASGDAAIAALFESVGPTRRSSS